MSTFLIIFLFVYGSMNGYALFRVKAAFDSGTGAMVGWGIIFAFLFLSPIIVRFVEKAGYDSIAVPMAWVAFTWLGLLFLFIASSLPIEIYRLLIYVGEKSFKAGLGSLRPSYKLSLYLPLFIACIIAVYGFFETGNIRTEKIILGTKKLPPSVRSFKIVQISDLHVGPLMKNDRLKKIIETIKEAQPDILVSTGDLVDGLAVDLDGTSSLFDDIKTNYGKYAVTGNHEFYAGIKESIEFTRKGGFVVLRDAGASISGIINIAGVDDSTASTRFNEERKVEETDLLSSLSKDRFTLLLKHRPDIDEKSLGLFDLQLSGHTHRGQIFPFVYVVKIFFPYIAGLYSLSEDSQIYTSRGTGTWGPPIRFLSPPEVTVIEVFNESL